MGEFFNLGNLGVKAFDWTNSRNSGNSDSFLQIITLTVNSAFQKGTQGGSNAQHRSGAKFQAPYARIVHENE